MVLEERKDIRITKRKGESFERTHLEEIFHRLYYGGKLKLQIDNYRDGLSGHVMIADVPGLGGTIEHKLSQDQNPQDQLVLDWNSLGINQKTRSERYQNRRYSPHKDLESNRRSALELAANADRIWESCVTVRDQDNALASSC